MTCLLLQGDCTQIPVSKIGHHVLGTDPPYGEHVHARMTSCAQRGAVKNVRHRDAGFAPLTAELRQYVANAAKAAKRWSLVYSDLQGAYLWEASFHSHREPDGLIRTVPWIPDVDVVGETSGGCVGWIPWIRWSSPQQSGDRPPSGCEVLVLGHASGKMRWGGPGNLVCLRHKCERGETKHPTAKPLDQALDLVAWHSDPGELWYDPCAGRGTFGVACALLGREYLGFELDPREAELGAARVEKALNGNLDARDSERFCRFTNSLDLDERLPLALRGAKFAKGKVL